MRKTKKAAVYILSTALALSQIPALSAGAEEPADGIAAGSVSETAGENGGAAAGGETWAKTAAADIEIRTAEEFAAFGQLCRDQAYTQGKTVSLMADIDLTGTDFSPVPAFFGTFEGNGHTISGLSITKGGARMGLFRYVEQGAAIQNLNVSGTLKPEGSRKEIGGIAGINRGTIRNCTFSGSIEAKETLGGIAGFNEETGVIENCTNRAELTGNREAGGIAGKNEGVVTGSFNSGAINTNSPGVEDDESLTDGNLSVSMNLDLDRSTLKQDLQTEKVNDVGGIAGYSSGTIRACRNEGAIGYRSVGYNVGGIAGRHSGLLLECKNAAEVTGRKDVGGIAGQLEPFLSVEYENSTLDEVSDITDRMLDTRDAMVSSVEGTTDSTTDSIDRMDDIMKQIKELTRDKKAEQRRKRLEYEESANNELDEIDEVLANMELDLGSRDADRAASRVKGNVSNIRRLLEKLGGDDLILSEDDPEQNLAAMLQYYEEIVAGLESNAADMAENADEMVTERINGIEDGIDEFEGELDELRIAAKELLDDTRDYKDQLLKALDGVDDDVTAQLDRLYDELDSLQDTLKSGRDQVRSERETLDRQIEDIKSSIDGGRERLQDDAEDLLDEDTDLFTDISETAPAQTSGVTLACRNTGAVTADYQGGGIVGTVGIEIGLDPDEDIREYGDRTLRITRSAAAYVQECRNDGDIAVRSDYAGGIAGAAWIGSLKNNQNYGDISSEDGNYVGGIAGGSRAALTGSYSMCQVSGNDYVGGIAGSAKTARDNGTMAAVVSVSEDDDSEYLGSVIGGREDEEDYDISGNFFVDDGELGAVDGVTYTSEAAGLTYADFTARDGVPEDFMTLRITFLADDQEVKEITCRYGDSVAQEEIPQVPEKEGFFAAWETADLQNVRRSCRISAVYTPWVSTIGSSPDPKPELLAEAAFMPGATLTVAELSDEERALLPDAGSAKIVGAYRYEALDPENPAAPETVTLHVLSGGANMVALAAGDVFPVVDAKTDGDYLVFDAPASGEYVLLKRVPANYLAAGAAVLAAGIFLVFRKKKQKTEREEVARRP